MWVLPGEHRGGTPADGRCYAWKAAGRGLQVDKAEPFDPARGIRHAGQAKEVRRAIDVADLLIRHRAEKADVAVDRRDEALQLLHIIILAIRPDHQPRDLPAQFSGEGGQRGKGDGMPLAACNPGNGDDDNSVGRDSIRGPRCGASVAMAEPEIRHAQPYGMNTLGVDAKPLAK